MGDIYLHGGGVELEFPQNQDELKIRLENQKKPITLTELGEILNITIKHDETNKLITFLTMLLTYTDQDQMNLAYNAESSTGKSYIPIQIAMYFPDEDVLMQGYTSPTAFFHEYGELEGTGDFIEGKDGEPVELKKKVIDLSKKIIIFIDQPHDMVLQRLRPILSHDKKRIMHKITDRSRKHSRLQTQSIEIIGYPTVIFCSTKFSLSEQERTRLLLLSPEIEPDKIVSAIELLSLKLANREVFNKTLETDVDRNFLRLRINAIKTASVKEVIIPEHLRKQIIDKFKLDHENPIPRHQRDFPRMLGIIKAHALLNLHQRNRNGNNLLVKEEDVTEGYRLYSKISESNELGIPPEVFTFFNRIFKPIADQNGYATKRDLAQKYYKTFHKTIGKKRLQKTLEMLLETGLMVDDVNPLDRRVKIYVYPHVEGEISHEGATDLHAFGVPRSLRDKMRQIVFMVDALSRGNVNGNWVSDEALKDTLTDKWKITHSEIDKLLEIGTREGVLYQPGTSGDRWAVT